MLIERGSCFSQRAAVRHPRCRSLLPLVAAAAAPQQPLPSSSAHILHSMPEATALGILSEDRTEMQHAHRAIPMTLPNADGGLCNESAALPSVCKHTTLRTLLPPSALKPPPPMKRLRPHTQSQAGRLMQAHLWAACAPAARAQQTCDPAAPALCTPPRVQSRAARWRQPQPR